MFWASCSNHCIKGCCQTHTCNTTGTTLYISICAHVQARAVISEWLKELTLFDHLLHGLFSFLSDSTILLVKDEMIEGTCYVIIMGGLCMYMYM